MAFARQGVCERPPHGRFQGLNAPHLCGIIWGGFGPPLFYRTSPDQVRSPGAVRHPHRHQYRRGDGPLRGCAIPPSVARAWRFPFPGTCVPPSSRNASKSLYRRGYRHRLQSTPFLRAAVPLYPPHIQFLRSRWPSPPLKSQSGLLPISCAGQVAGCFRAAFRNPRCRCCGR